MNPFLNAAVLKFNLRKDMDKLPYKQKHSSLLIRFAENYFIIPLPSLIHKHIYKLDEYQVHSFIHECLAHYSSKKMCWSSLYRWKARSHICLCTIQDARALGPDGRSSQILFVTITNRQPGRIYGATI